MSMIFSHLLFITEKFSKIPVVHVNLKPSKNVFAFRITSDLFVVRKDFWLTGDECQKTYYV